MHSMKKWLPDYNLKAHKAGKAPQGFPGWFFKQMHSANTSLISRVQSQVNSLATSFMEQPAELSYAFSQEEANSDFSL